MAVLVFSMETSANDVASEPQGTLAALLKLVGEHDTHTRTAALNALSSCYMAEGSSLWSHLDQTTAEASILRDKLTWVDKESQENLEQPKEKPTKNTGDLLCCLHPVLFTRGSFVSLSQVAIQVHNMACKEQMSNKAKITANRFDSDTLRFEISPLLSRRA